MSTAIQAELPPELLAQARAFTLEEFERDMDLLADGLEHVPSEYEDTYSREDIY